MLRIGKLALVTLAVAAVFGAMAGSASARNLSVEEQGFRITWTELEMKEPIFNIGFRCPLTLEGTFHYRTMVKSIGSLIGYITRAILDNPNCSSGHVTVLTETLPWHVTYEGFTGTLPRITGLVLLLVGFAFRLETAFTCLARSENLRSTITGSTEAGGAFKPEILTPGRETIPCGGITLGLEGRGTVTKLGRTERILVRLI